jgi:hypothetical protein
MVIYTNDYTKCALANITIEPHAHVRKEEWKVSKMMHSYNILFVMLLHIIYQHDEWASYFNFWNVITFMITNLKDPVNWVDIMFNHMKELQP